MTVRGRYLSPDGRPLSGSITFRAPAQLTFPQSDVILGGPVTAPLDAEGSIAVTLPATDAPNMDPVDWAYVVAEQLAGIPAGRSYSVVLPSAYPEVDLADIAPTDPAKPTYVGVPGPEGPQGPAGTPGSRIYNGTEAPDAALGVDGDLYVRYETTVFLGVTSTTVTTWQKTAGAWGQLAGDIRGAAWYVNNTSTSSSTTRPGDLLLRTDTGDVWQRGASGWGASVGNLKGPKGDQGDTGPTGAAGAPGVVQSVNGKSAADIVLDAADVGAILTTAAGAAGGVAQLDASGKVPAAQLPDSSGGGAVDSVNGQTGVVVLAAADVGAAAADHTHTAAQVGAIPTTARGAASGVASLDTAGRIPVEQLPSTATRNMWTPAALGFQAWSCDPAHVSNPTTVKAAVLKRIYMCGIYISEPTPVNRVVIFARGWAGSTAVPAARFYAGIYNDSGARVATSGQVSSLPPAGQLTGTAPGGKNNHIGAVPIALPSTVTLQPGRYWAAFLLSAGSATDFYYMHVQNESPSAPANFFLGTTFQRAWCVDNQTSLPSTVSQSTGEVGLDPAIMALALV
ncbi:collagen-like protein [Streptomyces sp. TRM49041]|uniref:collagen-like protein n=1 Tax=Streptomyces sp. TRM49041 TaxID=2603216 RepID=UPI0016568BE2|nr:collagen-like protein [Streptomyces sp. TRM49041]